MNDWAALDRALAAMASSGSAEVREDGEWLAELSMLDCELRSAEIQLTRIGRSENWRHGPRVVFRR